VPQYAAGKAFFADSFVAAQADQQHAFGGGAFDARSSRVVPALPVMSPDFSAAVIAPAPSSALAACDSFLFSKTATAMRRFGRAMVFFVSNAFMLKSI
jgi:hypothetical protein